MPHKRRSFTFEPIWNTPENADALIAHGIDPAVYYDGLLLVVNVELGLVQESFSTQADFDARYEPVED